MVQKGNIVRPDVLVVWPNSESNGSASDEKPAASKTRTRLCVSHTCLAALSRRLIGSRTPSISQGRSSQGSRSSTRSRSSRGSISTDSTIGIDREQPGNHTTHADQAKYSAFSGCVAEKVKFFSGQEMRHESLAQTLCRYTSAAFYHSDGVPQNSLGS